MGFLSSLSRFSPKSFKSSKNKGSGDVDGLAGRRKRGAKKKTGGMVAQGTGGGKLGGLAGVAAPIPDPPKTSTPTKQQRTRSRRGRSIQRAGRRARRGRGA